MQIHADDSAGVDELVSTLGTGEMLLTKINTALWEQDLNEASGVSAPVRSGSDGGVSSSSSPVTVSGAQTKPGQEESDEGSQSEESGGVSMAAIGGGAAGAVLVTLAGEGFFNHAECYTEHSCLNSLYTNHEYSPAASSSLPLC